MNHPDRIDKAITLLKALTESCIHNDNISAREFFYIHKQVIHVILVLNGSERWFDDDKQCDSANTE